MKPVFSEELDFLKIKHNDKLWVDARCYYAFDKDMNRVMFGRNKNKIPNDLSPFLSHEEFLIKYFKLSTVKKVELEKKKLNKFLLSSDYDEIAISVSGGKDSTVVADMCYDICKSHKKTRVIFANTTNETHFTYRYIKKTYGSNLEIINPKTGFYKWCKDNNFIPTRFSRACCKIFKEGIITPYLDNNKRILHVCGVRRSESKNRSSYEQLRKGNWDSKKAKENWDMYLPIVDFDDLDVWAYIFYNNIDFNTLYRFGYNRVGCTNCPYRSDYELTLNEHFLPTYAKHWDSILTDVFIRNCVSIKTNCTLKEFLNGAWKSGVFRDKPTKEVIEEFAHYSGVSYKEAERYFKANKCKCGKSLSKDVIALNMKILGRDTEARMCLKCLSEFAGATQSKLKEDIKKFKEDGCKLF